MINTINIYVHIPSGKLIKSYMSLEGLMKILYREDSYNKIEEWEFVKSYDWEDGIYPDFDGDGELPDMYSDEIPDLEYQNLPFIPVTAKFKNNCPDSIC